MLDAIGKPYGVREEQSVQSRALKEPNFRFARHPTTIVTWAELHFYDLPLIRPSGFVNSGRSALRVKNCSNCSARQEV
jgi:hypothetical protein